MKISIVVAAFNSADSIRKCAESLLSQIETDDEVIVCTNLASSAIDSLRADLPTVKWRVMASDTTVPTLRAEGARFSTSPVVAFTEDHFYFASGWRGAMGHSFEEGKRVAAGPVEMSGGGSPFDWAMYLFDYGRFMPPGRSGPQTALTGANMACLRELLTEDLLAGGLYETELSSRLRARGETLWINADAVAYHLKRYDSKRSRALIRHGARTFAAQRLQARHPFIRAAYALGTPLLVVLMPLRILLLILKRRRHGREWVTSLPHLLAISASWAFGELLGSLGGDGGSAAEWK